MSDESYSFTAARARLEEIVAQVRKKDTSLEKSLDLLEEGVRLANVCTEQIDHADWVTGGVQGIAEEDAEGDTGAKAEALPVAATTESDELIVVEGVAVIDDVVVVDEDGGVVAEVVEVTEYVTTEAAEEDFAGADDAWAEDVDAPHDADAEDDLRA